MTNRIGNTLRRMLVPVLLTLTGMLTFTGTVQAQIPDARAGYHGNTQYENFGWTNPITLSIDTQYTFLQGPSAGQFAIVMGDLFISDWHYIVFGEIDRNGWLDIDAFDDWGAILHFSGWQSTNSYFGWKTFGGTWEVFVDHQGFYRLGTFFVSAGIPFLLF